MVHRCATLAAVFILGMTLRAYRQAAAAAVGTGLAVIPYCFTRALSEMTRNDARREE